MTSLIGSLTFLHSKDKDKEIEFEHQKNSICNFILRAQFAQAHNKPDRFALVKVVQKLPGHDIEALRFLFFNSVLEVDWSRASYIEMLLQNKFFFVPCCAAGKQMNFHQTAPGLIVLDTNDEGAARNILMQYHQYILGQFHQSSQSACSLRHVLQNGALK